MKFVPSFHYGVLRLFFLSASLFGSLSGQVFTEVLEEARQPIPVSGKSALACNLSVSGQILVGSRSSKGGQVSIKSLSGGRVLALHGALRLHSGTGRFADQIWRGDVLSQSSLNQFSFTPEGMALPSGVSNVTRSEWVVLGILYDDHSTCGAEAAVTRSRFLRRVEAYSHDIGEAIAASKALPKDRLAKKISAGLLEAGPYSRETSPVANATLRAYLLDGNLELRPDFEERLKRMLETVKRYGEPKSAKPPRQKL